MKDIYIYIYIYIYITSLCNWSALVSRLEVTVRILVPTVLKKIVSGFGRVQCNYRVGLSYRASPSLPPVVQPQPLPRYFLPYLSSLLLKRMAVYLCCSPHSSRMRQCCQ
jgi:hypothetical protein